VDALHEAGHAIVAELVGIEVDRVVLCPLGRTMRGYCDVRVPQGHRLHDALVDVAGPAAECLAGLAPKSARVRAPHSWRFDFENVRKAGFSRAERELLMMQAMGMLRTHKRAWERVAVLLEERDVLGLEVREALCRRVCEGVYGGRQSYGRGAPLRAHRGFPT
jgi:hypothetical protein